MASKGSVSFGVQRQVQQDQSPRSQALPAANIPRIQYSTGVSRALQSFSQDLFSISSRIEDQLDDAAEAEAEFQGATDGLTGNLSIQEYSTIRGRAYNRAGIQTMVSSLETSAIVRQSELENKYGNDPATLQRELENYHKGVASEIDKVSPGAGAQYRSTAIRRGLPAIERAKDAAFALTKDQAEAALIQNQAAIQHEIKAHASDLFSGNPARSQASMQAISAVQGQVTRIYNATDSATGKPLYSAAERAKAKKGFYDEVVYNASLSWFDSQENKSDAYMKLMNGETKVEVNVEPAQVNFIDNTKGKIRDLPVTKKVKNQISTAVSATDPTLEVMIVSGGQPGVGTGGRRTGSTRHDHGNAADIILVRNGEPVRPGEDPELYEKFLENVAASGATGIGHYEWGVHVGGGKRAAWGPNTRSNTLDPRFGEAIKRGWSNPINADGETANIDLLANMSDTARSRLDAEMRSRITFANQMADRDERLEEKNIKVEQETKQFELADRLYNGGQETEDGRKIEQLTRDEVVKMVELDLISPRQGEAFVKALVQEKPDSSDRTFFDEVNRRLYNGEDITQLVLDNPSKLSKSDASSFLSKNRSINVLGEGSLTNNQKFQFDRLKDALTPDSMMQQIDPSADVRKFNALDEFRQRVAEGEDAREVANDIGDRASRDFDTITRTKIDKLLKPRFYVEGVDGMIDIPQSKRQLRSALQGKRISEASYKRQVKLIKEWADTQERLSNNGR